MRKILCVSSHGSSRKGSLVSRNLKNLPLSPYHVAKCTVRICRMGNRTDRRIFRRRRRRVGLVLFASLGILLLGGLLFSSLVSTGRTAVSVERVEVPLAASAPQAVQEVEQEQVAAEQATAEQAAAEQEAAESEAASEEQAAEERAEQPKPAATAEPAAPPDPVAPPPPADKTTYLTVPKIGLYDNAVYNSSDPATLDVGAAKLKESGFPWQESANPYISAHRLGWPGTASHYQFYNLPLMTYGDPIYLTDANGTTYTYEVTEIIEVAPNEVWVSEPEAGRDMISLQTCTEAIGDYWTMGPTWSARYVVRGDRIDVSYA